MTTTDTIPGTFRIRIGDAQYERPFPAGERQDVYPPGTWLVVVYYDDGDRFLTVAGRDLLAAWGIAP